jgi:hypothetical protein
MNYRQLLKIAKKRGSVQIFWTKKGGGVIFEGQFQG